MRQRRVRQGQLRQGQLRRGRVRRLWAWVYRGGMIRRFLFLCLLFPFTASILTVLGRADERHQAALGEGSTGEPSTAFLVASFALVVIPGL